MESNENPPNTAGPTAGKADCSSVGERATLSELHDLLDCIRSDFVLTGLDEVDTTTAGTLAVTLHEFYLYHEKVIKERNEARDAAREMAAAIVQSGFVVPNALTKWPWLESA